MRESDRRERLRRFIHNFHRRVGRELAGPEQPYVQSSDSAIHSGPPGEFLSRELESDCARFLEHAKALARRRAEALAEADQH